MIQKTIEQFCKDVLNVLKLADEEIYNDFTVGDNKIFNSIEWKGLAVYSITEPIIKFIIFTKLAKKYKLWSEENFGYGDKRQLDLALLLEEKEIYEPDEKIYPDTAIEMKWAGVKKDSTFFKNSRVKSQNDILKLASNKLKNRFFMQFMITNRLNEDSQLEDLNLYIDNRRVKVSSKPVYHDSFNTDCGIDSKNKNYNFHIIVWKIN